MFASPPLDVVALTPSGTYDRFRSRVSGYPETLNEFPVVALAEEILTPGEGLRRRMSSVANLVQRLSLVGKDMPEMASSTELLPAD